jgi:hypothetical protein
MCKHCARIFYKKNPGRWIGIHEFEALPPLGSFRTGKGFVPDFPALLMFDEFVLDGDAAELLRNPGERHWLRQWTELVKVLESEGTLTVADVSAAASKRSYERGWMLRRDLADPARWWQAMAYYNALTGKARQLLGDNPRVAQNYAWDFDPDAHYGVRGSDGHVHDLAAVLSEAGEFELEAHRNLFAQALHTVSQHLREVNSCIIACKELDVAPMMWAPYRRYLDEKLQMAPQMDAVNAQSAGRQFFEIAFPAYAPATVRDFALLRRDRRIHTLRSEILSAAERGELIDPQYPQRVLAEVLRLEQKSARVRRIAGWIANAVGLIPVPGLGLAATGASEAVTEYLDRKRRKPWHWFYLISDGRGAT